MTEIVQRKNKYKNPVHPSDSQNYVNKRHQHKAPHTVWSVCINMWDTAEFCDILHINRVEQLGRKSVSWWCL